MTDPIMTPFECIDPRVGEQIWRLQQSDLDAATRATLEAHVAACHACRLVVGIDTRARRLAQEGRLAAPAVTAPAAARRATRRHLPWVAPLATAAALAAVFHPPPRPVSQAGVPRGPGVVCFLRPVEGEVVTGRRPMLQWTPLAGATGYSIELRDPEGRAVWSGESTEPQLRVTPETPLARGRAYRALLSVRPADLAPPAPASVRFRSDTLARLLLHRLLWAHPLAQAALLAALAAMALAAWRRRN